jgi:Ca2+-binding RTX toxin-like protein
VAVIQAALLALPTALIPAAHAVVAPVGGGFTVTPADLAFILKQIKIAERHSRALAGDPTAASQPNPNPSGDPEYCQSMIGTAVDQVPDVLTSYGLRTVDGQCNNLVKTREQFAAADQPFPRLTTPVFNTAEQPQPGFPPSNDPGNPSTYALPGNVTDTQPRVISNLIVDQTSTNPAAVAAAGFPVRTQRAPGVHPCTTDPDPTANPPVVGVPAGCVPSHQTLFIPNVSTDTGLSPPFNSLFTFFGQFFDHGVDQTVKAGGTVFVPLRPDDPLIAGPDHIFGTADDLAPQLRFMALTRARTDNSVNAPNTDTPWVDQSQTYTSHPSHQVFVREYALNAANHPVSTGKLLGGLPGGQTYFNSPDGQDGIGTWLAVKQQAASKLGLLLQDKDVTNIPTLLTDPYGNFIPGPNGLPQYVTASGLVEGNLASPVPVPADVVHFNTPFLTDIAHNADPSPQRDPATGVITTPVPDTDNTPSADFASQPPGTYDDEMLNAHFACGDGRCNENIALSTIHQVFHSEHDRLVDYIKGVLTTDTSPSAAAALAQWQLPTSQNPDGWNGSRLFQAARFVTEMEYQHLVFEEFARKVQPLVHPFHVYSPDVNPAIANEFAAAVYRFGHSMLDDTVARTNVDPVTGAKSDNSLPLLNAFLNPPAFFDGGPTFPSPNHFLTPKQAAGFVVMGSTDQTGNEIDEFVTETLRNNLLGLPLDLPTLNMSRARESGIPPLNNLRRQLLAQTNDGQLAPYTSWSDYGQHLKHPESLINFVAAYGTHPTIRDSGPDGVLGTADDVTTLAAKRAAARAIVNPSPGDPLATPPIPADVPPADAADFMFSTGTWASGASGATTTGLDSVDLWVGGLAELTNQNGGMLGSTFNYVFQLQLEKLQDGDRFYYLARTPGLNLRTQLEGNSFAELIERNTDGTSALKADVFGTADCKFQLANLNGTPAGFAAHGATVTDDPTTPCREDLLLLRKPDGTIQYKSINSVDPPGINGQSVYNGTAGADRVVGGVDNDTIWGNDGNDVLEGNNGDDTILGGNGNDIITDLAGADVLKGGPGNDAIDGGIGNDIILGGDGQDFLNGGANDNEVFAGPGNDFIIGGQGADTVFGDGGDDWIQGGTGQDLLQGDHGAPFFDDPGQVAPGNDILIGQPGENDYDAEGGDDIMAQNPGIDRNAGAGGFDWAIHQYDPTPANDDMMINNNLGGLPIQVIVNRDRWQETEADSGGASNDVIKGTDGVLATPRLIGGAGFQGCDALDQAGVARIKGLDALLPPVAQWPGTAAAVAALSVPGFCPLTGPVWGEGDILIGGGGSDTITGRGGDEIIDGDKSLEVHISVRTDPANPVTETGRTDLMENKATSGDFGPGTAGMTLQQAVFAGLVDPGNLVAVREIVSPATVPPADCGAAAPLNCDTAVFSGPQSNYSITTAAGGKLIVSQTGANVAGQKTSDGTDTLTNIEQLEFFDQSTTPPTPVFVPVSIPAAPTGVTAAAGINSATVSWSFPLTPAVASFEIIATPATGTPITFTGILSAARTNIVTGLSPSTSYTFQVQAVNQFGPGARSASSSPPVTPLPVATAPAVPTGLVVLRGNASVALSWTDGAVPVTGHLIQVRIGAVLQRTDTVGPLNSTVITGLTNGTAYSFRVQALNGALSSAMSAASARVTPAAVPDAPVIGAPAQGRAGGALTAAISWTAPANTGGSRITGYQVVALTVDSLGNPTGATTTSPVLRAGAQSQSFTLPAGSYRFTVTAINAVGQSLPSAMSTVVTPR